MNARQLIEAEDPKSVFRAATEREELAWSSSHFERGQGFYIECARNVLGDMRPAHDLGEGPWETLEDAQEFFDSEVGVKCRIVFVNDSGVKFPATNWMKP